MQFRRPGEDRSATTKRNFGTLRSRKPPSQRARQVEIYLVRDGYLAWCHLQRFHQPSELGHLDELQDCSDAERLVVVGSQNGARNRDPLAENSLLLCGCMGQAVEKNRGISLRDAGYKYRGSCHSLPEPRGLEVGDEALVEGQET